MRTRGSVDCDQTLPAVRLSKRGEAGSPDYKLYACMVIATSISWHPRDALFILPVVDLLFYYDTMM